MCFEFFFSLLWVRLSEISLFSGFSPPTLSWVTLAWSRVIYNRVRNRKKYFEIAAFLNFEWGTLRAGNSNENKNTTQTNKHISVATKLCCEVKYYFEFSCSWYSSFNWQKGGNFKIIFPVPYSIIYNPGLVIPSMLLWYSRHFFFNAQMSKVFSIIELL